MNKKVSIILSTYNEALIINKTINEIFSTIDNVEIVLVDDNSNDGTLEKVNSINNKNLKVFSRQSRGLASAFLLGMINTDGDLIGWTDSNMPQLTHHFNEMIKKLNEYDVVLLSRYVDGGGDQRSKMRILSSKIINFICRLILGSEIKDYTSSIFLMRREVLKCGVPIAYGHGEFFIEFLYKIKKNKMKIIELPYVQPPDAEGSKTASSILRFFTLGFGYLTRIAISRFRKN
ncbi:glycosyltransferase [Candidatus Pelagibacter sp.]|nr:glycosyltransferase [Candidatus Pelagibacter sp.]